MPHVKIAYASLLGLFEGNLPWDPNKPWDFLPFNSQTFCEHAGLESTEVGLSKPPVGKIGRNLGPATRRKWATSAKRAEEFIGRAVKQYQRTYQTADHKGKYKRFSLETFYRDVLSKTPGHEAWEWLVAQTFGRAGGLHEAVKTLMRDYGCDELAGYRSARRDLIYRLKGKFKEADLTFSEFSQFDKVWVPARENFGRGLIGNFSGDNSIPPWTWPMLRAFCARYYETAARSLIKSIDDITNLEKKLETALAQAQESPTKTILIKAGRFCGDVHRVHRALGLTEQAIEETPARKQLDALMDSLGRCRNKSGKSTFCCIDIDMRLYALIIHFAVARKPPKHPKAHLVSSADLDAAWMAYQMAIWDPRIVSMTDVEPALETTRDDEAFTEVPIDGVNDFPTDLGVSAWKGLTGEKFMKGFGIPSSGLPGSRLGDDGRPAMSHMEHQYAGIAEMAVRSFTEADGDVGALPTLLADAVGLGKTAQVIGLIQLIWHLKTIQDSNPHWPEEPESVKVKWPPFLRGRKSFMGQGRIPALPFLIVLPLILMAQWRSELEMWLNEDACHILQYQSTDLDYQTFLLDDRPYLRAKQEAGEHWERTIIMVEAPALLKEGRILLTRPGEIASADPSEGNENDVKRSIFGQKFLLGVVDEAHTYRNLGNNYPTHPRNLLLAARILRLLPFIGPAGVEMTARIDKLFKEGKKDWETELDQEALTAFLADLRSGNLLENADPAERSSQSIAQQLPGGQLLDPSKYQAFWATRKALYFLRHQLRNVIIRRDSRSKDSQGNSLLGLMDKVEITSFIKLYKTTLAAVEKEAERLKSIRGGSSRSLIQGFYTRLKQILVHHIIDQAKADTDIQGFFKTLEDYFKDPSAKIDRVLRLADHHIGPKNATAGPLYWDADGNEVAGPALAENDVSEEDLIKRKMVIYCHLSQSWSLLDHILSLRGFSTVQVNGSMLANQRNEAIRSFNSEDGPDIMLLSNVGSTGLNLQRGSIVVFVDHPWSDAEAQQIVGRVLRRGQKRQVLVYRIVAPRTPDEYLIGYAAGKKLMQEVLIEVLQITGMTEEDIITALEAEEDESDAPRRKSRAQGRGAKALIGDEAIEADEADEAKEDMESTGSNEDDDDDAADRRKRGSRGGASGSAARQTATNPGRSAQALQSRPSLSHTGQPIDPDDVLPSNIRSSVAKNAKPHPQFPSLGPRPRAQSQHRKWWDGRIKHKEEQKRVNESQAALESQRIRNKRRRDEDEAKKAKLGPEERQYIDNLERYAREGSEDEDHSQIKQRQYIRKLERQYVRENQPSAQTEPPKPRARPRMRPPPSPEPASSAPGPTVSPVLDEAFDGPDDQDDMSAPAFRPEQDKGKGKGKGKGKATAETEDEATDSEIVPETTEDEGEKPQDIMDYLPELTPNQTMILSLVNSDIPKTRISAEDAIMRLNAMGETLPPDVLQQLQERDDSSTGPIAGPSCPMLIDSTGLRLPPSPILPTSPAKRRRLSSGRENESTSGEDFQVTSANEGVSELGARLSPDWDDLEGASEGGHLPQEFSDLTLEMEDEAPPPNQHVGQKRARAISLSSSSEPATATCQRTAGSLQSTPSGSQDSDSPTHGTVRARDREMRESSPVDIRDEAERLQVAMIEAMRGGGRGRGRASWVPRGRGF
ncbi:unnamed protein product [Rhizoctonia solani]|uniref:Helicase C-terminal domain-containing protein n=1 Tax=Rhizoctonia solani TaxID=456999 RepID=A0A8H3HEB8_9AGAM|nr:unnamed protein product [Rhizoctonia solani]